MNDIAEIVMGQSPPGQFCSSDRAGTPLLNGPTEFGYSFPVPVQFTTAPKRFAQAGDILFCVRGSTTGRMNIADRKYAIGRGIAAIRGKSGYPTAFVKGLIDVSLPELLAVATGSTFPNVSREMLVQLNVPEIRESHAKKIAQILSSLDEKIDLNRRMNATLEAIARALFKAWFVDFEPVRANMEGRLSESASPEIAKLFPSTFENGIPKGWHDNSIGRIISIQNGYAFKSSDFREAGEGGVIKIKNISGNQVDVLNTQFIDDSIASTVKERFKISSNDVLIAMTGAEVGKVGLVPRINSALWLNQRVGLIRENLKGSKCFSYLFLSSEETRNQLLDIASGSAQPNISGTQIEAIKTITPTDKLVMTFGELVDPIFSAICEYRFENQLLAGVRDLLLPRLITGQTEISV